ncbi:unnamed protein product [Amoebophrya sp. A120]|nr:unnamed protein product [Amoebophrya sp. A120]|eukprot:GSA120T00017269001.1
MPPPPAVEHSHAACSSSDEEGEALGLNTKWLNPHIVLDQATALNVESGDIKRVLQKLYDDRLCEDEGKAVVATPDDDNEMLVFIPFSSPAQLQSIFVIGGEGSQHPRKARLFANPPNSCTGFADFEDRQPEQVLDLAEDVRGVVEYPVRANKFANLQQLVIHFETDDSADEKKVLWIGPKGTPTDYKRQAVITVYESQANVADHEAPDDAYAANLLQH